MPPVRYPPRTSASSQRRGWAKFGVSVVLSIAVFAVFSVPVGPLPPLGALLDPTTGLWSVSFGNRALQTQTLHVSGLSAPVTIVRDVAGVPHIYARDAADGWFAMGFVHAEDRLWQMDIQYRNAAGRLSEILGPSALRSDEFYRTIGLDRIAAHAVEVREQAGEIDATAVNAYTAGVNAYISSLDPPDYPIEFKLLGYAPEPWSAEKTLTVGTLLAWSLMGDFTDLENNLLVKDFGAAQARELFPDYPAGIQYPIQPASLARSEVPPLSQAAVQDILRKAAAASAGIPDFEGVGSNNWAVAGTRTITGKPLLAADPHLSFQLPAIWYEAELQAPPYHVRGATLPGAPAFLFGTNGYIAWGETNTAADVNDFFVENLSADHTMYLYGGTWHSLTVLDEPIRVKGGATVDFKVNVTTHGPILTEVGQTVSMQSTIKYFGDELRAILGINLAQNSGDFNASSLYWHVPAQNIIYADANGLHGNIGIRSTGWYPIRENFSGRLPVDGSNASYVWSGYVPFDAYPHAWNPSQGFVFSNNEVPYPPGYPYAQSIGSRFDPGFRARRIHELLAADGNVSLADMQRFQLDVRDSAAQSLVPYILRAVHPADGVDRQAYDALERWTTVNAYNMTADSVAATIWYTFTGHYMQDTFGDEYAVAGAANLSFPLLDTLENLTIRAPNSHWFDTVSAGIIVAHDASFVISQAFNDTVVDLMGRLGPTVASWTWGSVHAREFYHLTGLGALQRGPYPAGGDQFTLNVAGGLVSKFGSSWRQIIDFSNLDNSLAIYPGGQSGDPLSVHYSDFLQSYLAGKYLSFAAAPTPSSIPGASVESTITLVPS